MRGLGHTVVAMEDYVAREQRPLERAVEDVGASDLYVGIVAWRYGFVPGEGNPEGRSITELEYRAAGNAGVERLMFLLADNATWPVGDVDAGPARERVERFRGEVEETRSATFFGSCDELAASVAVAVQRASEEKRERERESYMDEHSWLASLKKVVQAAPQDRRAALLEWAERHGVSVVQVLGSQLANRYRSVSRRSGIASVNSGSSELCSKRSATRSSRPSHRVDGGPRTRDTAGQRPLAYRCSSAGVRLREVRARARESSVSIGAHGSHG